MKQKYSIEKVIWRGHLTVSLPAILLFFGVPGSTYLYVKHYGGSWWWMVPAVLTGMAASWFAWAFLITKWRIRAYEHVDDVDKLLKWAWIYLLIWPPGSRYEKWEIRSRNDQKILSELYRKSKQNFYREKEDFWLPSKTEIYYRKWHGYLCSLVVVLLIISMFVFGNHKEDLGEILLYAAALIFCGLWSLYVYFLSHRPVMIMDAKGIRISEYPSFSAWIWGIWKRNGRFKPESFYYSWADMEQIGIKKKGSDVNAGFYLYVSLSCEVSMIPIDDWHVSPRRLEKWIGTYRLRHDRAHGGFRRLSDEKDCPED